MDKQFTTGRVKQINVEDRTLTAYASTAVEDRDGDIILPTAWADSLEQFKTNPVLMWAHDYRIPPIGKINDIGVDDTGLYFTAEFAKTTFAEEIWGLYRDKFLNAFSVGFQPEEWVGQEKDDRPLNGDGRLYTKCELLEISGVPVPANPTCLVERGGPVLAFKSVDELTVKALDAEPLAEQPPEQKSAGNVDKSELEAEFERQEAAYTVTRTDDPELTDQKDEPTPKDSPELETHGTEPDDPATAEPQDTDHIEPEELDAGVLESIEQFINELENVLT
jgi:HK97 family phage prohead protease